MADRTSDGRIDGSNGAGAEGRPGTPSKGRVPSPRRRRVAICLWNDVELLDFAGPGEVFATARDGKAFRTYTVAESPDPIVSQGFVRVTPEYTINTCPPPHIVVLPGGGTENPLRSSRMLGWVSRVSNTAEVLLSVCTGALVLAAAGLLDGLEATTWHGAVRRLRRDAPGTIVHDNRRFVDNGRIVTAAGVSAGIDGALHLVARLCGSAVAVSTAQYMEYDWRPDLYAAGVLQQPQATHPGRPELTEPVPHR